MRRFFVPSLIAVVTVATIVAACDDSSTTATGPSAATAIGLTGGNVQVAAVGSALTLPLIVHVTDQYGVGFPGALVTFTASGGASTTSATVTTDASGNASNTATLGLVAGTDTIVATISGAVTPATFVETAVAGPPAVDSLASGNIQVGTTGVVLPVPLSVIVIDSHGNRVVGDTVTWVAATGTLNTPSAVTDATGTASAQFTPALGANAVTAMIGGSALVVTFTETGN